MLRLEATKATCVPSDLSFYLEQDGAPTVTKFSKVVPQAVKNDIDAEGDDDEFGDDDWDTIICV